MGNVTKDSIYEPQDQLLSLLRNEAQGFVVLDDSTHNFIAITNVTQPQNMDDKLVFVMGQAGKSLSNPMSVQINISDLKKIVAVPFAESKARALGLRYFNYSTHSGYDSSKPFICPKENAATALSGSTRDKLVLAFIPSAFAIPFDVEFVEGTLQQVTSAIENLSTENFDLKTYIAALQLCKDNKYKSFAYSGNYSRDNAGLNLTALQKLDGFADSHKDLLETNLTVSLRRLTAKDEDKDAQLDKFYQSRTAVFEKAKKDKPDKVSRVLEELKIPSSPRRRPKKSDRTPPSTPTSVPDTKKSKSDTPSLNIQQKTHEVFLGKLSQDETDGLLYLVPTELSNFEFTTLVNSNGSARNFEGGLNSYSKSLKDTDRETWSKTKYNSISQVMYAKLKSAAWATTTHDKNTRSDLGISSFTLQSHEDNRATSDNNNEVEMDKLIDQPDAHKTKVERNLPRDMNMTTSYKLEQSLQNCASCLLYIAGARVDKDYGLNEDDCPVLATRLININQKLTDAQDWFNEHKKTRPWMFVNIVNQVDRGISTLAMAANVLAIKNKKRYPIEPKSDIANALSILDSTAEAIENSVNTDTAHQILADPCQLYTKINAAKEKKKEDKEKKSLSINSNNLQFLFTYNGNQNFQGNDPGRGRGRGRARGRGREHFNNGNNFTFTNFQGYTNQQLQSDDNGNKGVFTRLSEGPKVQAKFPKVCLKADPPGTEREFCFIGSTKGLCCKFGNRCTRAHITRLDQVSKGIFELAEIVKQNPNSIQWTNEEDIKVASKATKGE